MCSKKNVANVLVVAASLILWSSSTSFAGQCRADANCDTKVDLSDLIIMKGEFLSTGCDPCYPMPGMITMWAGSIATIPNGWLLCDGSEVSRTEYPELFQAILVTYGPGDAVYTFNLPDFINRSPMGASEDVGGKPMSDVSGSYEQYGGEAEHVLSISEMPSHSHAIDVSVNYPGPQYVHVAGYWNSQISTSVSGDIHSTGGGQAHNNLHPYFATVYIIYAGERVVP